MIGASGGVGSAVVRLLTEKGWRCLATSSRSGNAGADYYIDLTQPDTIATSAKLLPELDGIVICAGLEPRQSLTEMGRDHLNRMLSIHVIGPILLLQAVERKMRDGSAVVLLSSVAAYRGSYDPAYAAAKGAVVSLTRTLAREWSPRVRVNAVAPGLLEGTPVYERMTEDFRQRHRESTPLQRFSDTKGCAVAIEFLLTHKDLTGVVLHMNGGQYYG